MRVEIDTVGMKLNMIFADNKRSTYSDCLELTIINEEGEEIVRYAYIKKKELKRLAKSL